MRTPITLLALLALALAGSLPHFVFAAAPGYSYGGWLPFWKKSAGAAETISNIQKLKAISPFSYEMDSETGQIIDQMDVYSEPWPELFARARAAGVKIIPSVASLESNLIHTILSDPEARRDHVGAITDLAVASGYDGIDIDYENKKAETKKYFSKFIKELSLALHKEGKLLSCTVEPRTPASSRFSVPRPPVEYANDYAVLNSYCDEVRVMAYDQGNIDLKLNKSKSAKGPYLPVADPDWVEKVILETLKSVNRKKLVLGIPTYGYEYELDAAAFARGASAGSMPSDGWDRVRSVTFAQAMRISSSTGVMPVRNLAGEMSIAYATTTRSGERVVARIAWFPDAQSIAHKLYLVKKYKLKGAYFFKLDGEADPYFWNLLRD